MKLHEIFSAKMSRDDAVKEDVPSCVVPNAAMSPSQLMKMYSRGEIKPLANTLNETDLVERPAHTDPLLALSQAQDFNANLQQLALQPVSPQSIESGKSSDQSQDEPPAV